MVPGPGGSNWADASEDDYELPEWFGWTGETASKARKTRAMFINDAMTLSETAHAVDLWYAWLAENNFAPFLQKPAASSEASARLAAPADATRVPEGNAAGAAPAAGKKYVIPVMRNKVATNAKPESLFIMADATAHAVKGAAAGTPPACDTIPAWPAPPYLPAPTTPKAAARLATAADLSPGGDAADTAPACDAIPALPAPPCTPAPPPKAAARLATEGDLAPGGNAVAKRPAAEKNVVIPALDDAATTKKPQPKPPAKIGWASRAVIGLLRVLQSKPVEIVLFVPTYAYIMAVC